MEVRHDVYPQCVLYMFKSLPPFIRWTVLITFLLTLRSASSAPKPASDRMVVIVSVDGLAALYLNEGKAKMPVIRQLATEGAVAKGMIASLPTSTWPNHVTLVTGVSPREHGVLANNYWDRAQNKTFDLIADPIFNKDQIVNVPTLYDVAHAAGLTTAAINWPATRGATNTLDWTTPDVHSNDLYAAYSTHSLLREFKDAGIPYEKLQEYCEKDHDPERDVMNTQMLIHVLRKHQPNLSFLHLVNTDHVQHGNGPRSPEAYDAVTLADERIKEIREVLEKEFPGRATLIVTSDHGFIAVRQKIQPNVKLRQEGLLKVANGKMTDRRVFALNQGGACFFYIVDKEHRAELAAQVAALFKGAGGIDQIILPANYKKNGMVSPDNDPRMADLVMTAKDGFTFSNSATEDVVVTPASSKTIGSHGHSPNLPDMSATFLAWGRGIKKGATLGSINNIDVAPTAASLLGLKMKNVEGRVLKELLEK
jgi:predicted AlkP superfamily pyrophosphatase or phosphodiesterase